MAITSGLAAGIDASAHQAALATPAGITLAVLGTGPDLAYPRRHADLREAYTRVFGAPPGDDDERVAVDLAKALAAYQETLFSPRTGFDAFRDALQRALEVGKCTRKVAR